MFAFEIPTVYQRYIDYLPYMGAALVLSFILTPIVGYIARKLKVITLPTSMRRKTKISDFRHLEKQPTPRLGGVAVIIPLIVLTLIFGDLTPQVMFLLAGLLLLFVQGVVDDFFELSGRYQLLGHVLVAAFIAFSAINVEYVTNPFGPTINLNLYSLKFTPLGIPFDLVFPGDIFLFFWIVITINAVKWVSGSDALMEGNSFLCAITLFILSVRLGSSDTALISILFAGAILGFLPFNFNPSKILSGSAGKSTFGYLLAVLSILSDTKIATAIIILMLPLMDFVWVIFDRMRTHKLRNPLKLLAISDMSHLHHRLLELGLNERQVAYVEYTICGVFCALALAATGARKALLLIVTIIIISTFMALIRLFPDIFRKQKRPESDKTPESRYSY